MLTDKQEKYVQELIKGKSQREAYKIAYNASKMKDNTIDRKASELMKNGKVRARLEELRNQIAERNIVSVEWVLNNLKEVAERCMQAEPVLIKDGDEWINSGEYKFEHSGANKALELIGKHLGMFKDKVELSGELKMPSITISK